MAVIASALTGGPQAAFLFKEINPNNNLELTNEKILVSAGAGSSNTNNVLGKKGGFFVFQYWPTQISDSYDTEWSSKIIPGGSRPLYQYIAGGARTISFDAMFSQEVTDTSLILSGISPTFGDLTLPSTRYTVDVKGAIAALRGLQHPSYGPTGVRGTSIAPPKLRLCFPGLNLGGNTDGILCFLKTAKVTYQACFPDGTPRVATVAVEFVEIVQQAAADPRFSNIQFIGQQSFLKHAGDYKYSSTF